MKDLSSTEKKEIMAYTSSSYSADTDATVTAPSNFTITKTVLINARGIGLLRLPLPSSELEIPISTSEGELVYVSTRAKKCSGNATLYNANGKALVASKYLWGPGRDPKMRVLSEGAQEEISVKGKWTSRSQDFLLPSGQVMTWRYTREIDSSPANVKNKKWTSLVLEVPDSRREMGDGKKADTVRLAQLVRNEESRTPGTKKCDAGNGGKIAIDEQAMKSVGVLEEIVIASCLMMLKKEIDRRVTAQMLTLAAASSGGS